MSSDAYVASSGTVNIPHKRSYSMLHYLIRRFIPDHENTSDPQVRRAYGTVCSGLGIGLNMLISLLKLLAGTLSGSIAVMADGINNLSDAASSAITLAGFRLSGKKDDTEHPFGHGRMEYISGLIVAMVIILMGFELAKTSVSRIMHPSHIDLDVLTVVALLLSISVKVYMFIYNHRIGTLIDSPSMKATATDAAGDVLASLAVLFSGVIHHITNLNTDSWTGLIVSILILRAGYCAARDTISPLLGNPPDPEFVRQIEEIVLGHEQIYGMHDLIVHDYGPGRTIISLHAEVPADGSLIELHDLIDNAERRLMQALNIEAVIHMDPVYTRDEKTIELRCKIASALREKIDPRITIHDFRLSACTPGTNVLFDVVIPYGLNRTDETILTDIQSAVKTLNENLFPIVTLEHSYIPEKAD